MHRSKTNRTSTSPFPWLTALLAVWPFLSPASSGQTQGTAPALPAYQLLRQNEDWSYLRSVPEEAPRDAFDPIKYISLSDDGSVWLSFGGQIRERFEIWRNFNFGQPPTAEDDDEFLLSRFFLSADFHAGDHFRAFVMGKSALITDRDLVGGSRTVDEDEADLQDAFVDLSTTVGSTKFLLRTGRQEMAFGKQRLISPLDWANTRRTFDGFSASASYGTWTVSSFLTRLVKVDKYAFNEADNDSKFYGIYGAGKICEKTDLDLYALRLEHDNSTFNGTSGDEYRSTLGSRVSGPLGGPRFDYEVEGAWQTGDIGSADINASMFASQVGYKPEGCGWSPRCYLGFDLATGDDSPGDSSVETFNQLFPLGHEYNGYIDFLGRQNLVAAIAGLTLRPTEKLGTEIRVHQFWRESSSDGLYGVGGAAVAGFGGATSSSKDIGTEVDLTATFKVDRHSVVQAGYGHFFAGDFIEDASPGDDIDFVYFAWAFTF